MSGLPGPWSTEHDPWPHGNAIPVSDDVTRYVVGFLFWHDEVLLIRKARPSWQMGRLNGVGGHVEPGETALAAMRREFQEETGWAFLVWEHFATLTGETRAEHAGGKSGGFEIAFFRGDAGEWKPKLMERETDEPVEWVRVHAIAPFGRALPNLWWLVPMAYHAHRADWPFRITERTG